MQIKQDSKAVSSSSRADARDSMDKRNLHRSIQYLGSKLRLANAIADIVAEHNSRCERVCDLFSGSGVVSSVLGPLFPTVAVDIQEYARVLAGAVLRPSPVGFSLVESVFSVIEHDSIESDLQRAWSPLLKIEEEALARAEGGDPEYLARFLEALPLIAHQLGKANEASPRVNQAFQDVTQLLSDCGLAWSRDSVITRYYGGLYFSLAQAIQLEVISHAVRRLHPEECLPAMAALLSTASAISSTVGSQFAQPLRPRTKAGVPKPKLVTAFKRNRNLDVKALFREAFVRLMSRDCAKEGSMAIRGDFSEFLAKDSEGFGVIYADPPYTRDHYSRYYHVLETIARGDTPELSMSNLHERRIISRGVYRDDRHQSPFSISSQAPAAFNRLFEQSSRLTNTLILSYSPQLRDGQSRPRVMSVGRLIRQAEQHFRSVECIEFEGVAHSKLTKCDLHLAAPETAEVLLICRG